MLSERIEECPCGFLWRELCDRGVAILARDSLRYHQCRCGRFYLVLFGGGLRAPEPEMELWLVATAKKRRMAR